MPPAWNHTATASGDPVKNCPVQKHPSLKSNNVSCPVQSGGSDMLKALIDAR